MLFFSARDDNVERIELALKNGGWCQLAIGKLLDYWKCTYNIMHRYIYLYIIIVSYMLTVHVVLIHVK